MTDVNDFITNSDFAGLGSDDRLEFSFTIPARSVASGTLYTHPIQIFDLGLENILTNIQFRVTSVDNKWRKFPNILQFDTSNNYYLTGNGFGISNSSTGFRLGGFIVYENTSIGIVSYLGNNRSPAATVSVPDLTVDLRVYVYSAVT